jgi:antitoxin PrlF
MLTSTITSKGQITIPKEIRDALNLHPGDRLDFILDNGKVYVQPADVDVRSLSGLLYQPGRVPVSLEEMEAAIVQSTVSGSIPGVEESA